MSADFIALTGMCILNVLISITSPYFMVLNSARVIPFQIVTYVIYAAISLPLKFLIGNTYGVNLIPWVGAISYFALLTIPTIIRSDIELRKRKRIHNN